MSTITYRDILLATTTYGTKSDDDYFDPFLSIDLVCTNCDTHLIKKDVETACMDDEILCRYCNLSLPSRYNEGGTIMGRHPGVDHPGE